MKARRWVLSILAVGFAALSISLGFWQLRRLAERKRQNAFLASRRLASPLDLDHVPSDTGTAHFRRVHISGTLDYANEIVQTLRGREGSPGVNIITPLRRTTNDTAVLINRGWVYSPDGVTIDTRPWREPDSIDAYGFVETFPAKVPAEQANPTRPRSFRRLNRDVLAKLFPYPIARFYVVLTDSSSSPNAPPRVEPSPLDEGPHRSYAIQWFSFATISIIGLVIFLRRT